MITVCVFIIDKHIYAVIRTAASKGTYQAVFWVLIDLIIGLLGLIIKPFENQTEIFRELGLIINPLGNQAF